MLLSSVERLLRFLCVEDTPQNNRILTQYLYGISSQIQSYVGVDFEKISRTEYFNIHQAQVEFWARAIPIETITSVFYDSTSLFDGSQTEVADPTTGLNDRSIIIPSQYPQAKKCIRIIYTGGVSTEPTKSTFAISGGSGTFLANKFARGSLSGAVGIVSAYSSSSITLDNLYGVFTVGETLTMQQTEGGTDVSGISKVIDSITLLSLVEALPEVAVACEMQVRYNVKTKDDFELSGIGKDSTSRRPTEQDLTFRGAFQDLQPEVRSMVNKHRRYTV